MAIKLIEIAKTDSTPAKTDGRVSRATNNP